MLVIFYLDAWLFSFRAYRKKKLLAEDLLMPIFADDLTFMYLACGILTREFHLFGWTKSNPLYIPPTAALHLASLI